MIRAVIFDCFGVLTTDGWKQLREEFFSGDEDKIQRALDIDRAVNIGVMDYESFVRGVSDLTQLSETETRRRLKGNVPNKVLFEFIRNDLKAHHKIGMLSNMAGDWLNDLFDSEQVELFDAIVLSYRVGMVKPDSQIYRLIAENLGVLPEECIFIDDVERYCSAAKDAGMNAVYHTDTNETITKIKELISA